MHKSTLEKYEIILTVQGNDYFLLCNVIKA